MSYTENVFILLPVVSLSFFKTALKFGAKLADNPLILGLNETLNDFLDDIGDDILLIVIPAYFSAGLLAGG